MNDERGTVFGLARAAIGALLVGAVGCAAPAGPADPGDGGAADFCPAPAGARELRGMWIAGVANLDWPSAPGLPVEDQQAEYRALLDLAVQTGLNAVFVHVRPTADAYYDSPHEPWSHWISGTQGVGPGYDVLGFLVEEAHARNLEFHAWFNPYRVSTQPDLARLTEDHPARRNPDWIRTYDGKLYFDPGLPAVRDHIEKVVADVVERYDVDAVVFDDYFYPYPVLNEVFADDASFAAHGAGFASRDDWRRANVDRMLEQVGGRVHRTKPWVRFGISPFGIWRNVASDPTGSATSGFEAWSGIYADSRAWIRGGYIDYIAPQLYWAIEQLPARYEVLVPWWADEVAGTDVQLFIAQASYKIGGFAFDDPRELLNHLELNAQYPAVQGDIYFGARDVRRDPLGVTTLLATGPYARPALIPVPPRRIAGPPPGPVQALAVGAGDGGLSWRDAGDAASYYAVYRADGAGLTDGCAVAAAGNLIGTVRRGPGDAHAFADRTAAAGKPYTYAVTPVDRSHRQGEPRLVTVER